MIIELENARAQRAVAMLDSRLPAGLDYQGRHQPRPFVDTVPVDPRPIGQPMPAEACTELGEDDSDGVRGSFRLCALIVITTGVPFLLALVSAVMQLLGSGIGQP